MVTKNPVCARSITPTLRAVLSRSTAIANRRTFGHESCGPAEQVALYLHGWAITSVGGRAFSPAGVLKVVAAPRKTHETHEASKGAKSGCQPQQVHRLTVEPDKLLKTKRRNKKDVKNANRSG
jgi:hypothetical protein